MNRNDIIRIAQEAGFEVLLPSEEVFGRGGVYTASDDEISKYLEAFAALVASAEREECKKLCTWKTGNQFVDEAVAVCYRAIDQRGQV